jgi:hypothetical protein
MTKITRHRKGNLLGKKIFKTNTRKLKGGGKKELEEMCKKYKETVTNSIDKNEDETYKLLNFSIAETRAYIESLIVKKIIIFAANVFDEINGGNKILTKSLGLNELPPSKSIDINEDETPEGSDALKARVNLRNSIRSYMNRPPNNTVYSNKIQSSSHDRAIGFKLKHKSDSECLPGKDELFIVIHQYIPDIFNSLEAIYTLLNAIRIKPIGLTDNKINVTEANVGKICYDALKIAKFAKKKEFDKIIIKDLLKLKYSGMFEAFVFFSKNTYESYEDILKLFYSFSLFEDAYIKITENVAGVKTNSLVNPEPKSSNKEPPKNTFLGRLFKRSGKNPIKIGESNGVLGKSVLTETNMRKVQELSTKDKSFINEMILKYTYSPDEIKTMKEMIRENDLDKYEKLQKKLEGDVQTINETIQKEYPGSTTMKVNKKNRANVKTLNNPRSWAYEKWNIKKPDPIKLYFIRKAILNDQIERLDKIINHLRTKDI